MRTMTTREAINHVLDTELARDKKTLYLGETIRVDGATGASRGLFEKFGPSQVIECPVSENAILGSALGLALSGFRPVVEIYSADFALIVANEIISDIPKWRQQQALVQPLPITIRGWMGATSGLGPEHSQCMEAYFHHAPGLIVICPGSPEDVAGLLRAAIRSNDPVMFLEHRKLYDMTGDIPDGHEVPIGKGKIVRQGDDVTIVAWAWMRHVAVEAASRLEAVGISVELIDPRTIKPMDFALISQSVEKTGRLLVAEESPITGNIGAEIVATVSEVVSRPARYARVAMADVIHPYSASMEQQILPGANEIVETARKLVAGEPTHAAMTSPLQRRASSSIRN